MALVASLPEQKSSRKPAELCRLPPVPFFQALAGALKAIGLQLMKAPAHSLVDVPNKEDPVLRNDVRLGSIGRSTAAELWKARAQCQAISHGESTAYVMPRSLLRWQKDAAAPRGGAYQHVPAADLGLGVLEADACVRLATETNGAKLLNLWQRLKIAGGRSSNTFALDFVQWCKYRYDRVVVLTGTWATKLWAAPRHICPCLPFALSAACEHARVSQSLAIPGDNSLETFTSSRVGRPLKLSFTAEHRGLPASCLSAAAVRQEQQRADKAARDAQPPIPPSISEGLSTCARSDHAALPVPRPPASSACDDPPGGNSSRGPTEYRTDFDKVKAGHIES